MGIRINFYIVIGIDDAKEKDDPRRQSISHNALDDLLCAPVPPVAKSGAFKDLYVSKGREDMEDAWDGEFEGKPLRDFVYNASATDELTVGGVTGYLLDEGRNGSELCYGLAICFPQFQEPGYMAFPTREPHFREQASMRFGDFEGDTVEKAVKEKRLYQFEQAYMTDIWFRLAMHVLHSIGWTGLTRDMLKTMLVWDWS